MTIEFKLQEVSEGVETVDIADILVAPGDAIELGTVICEVETDKAVAEIECPHAGTVQEVLVSQGDTVAIGTTLLILDEPGDAETASSAATESTPRPSNSDSEPPTESSATAPASSVIEFRLQEVSDGIDMLDVAEVLVSAGDVISPGTVICEVETDKAVAEIECPHAGTITEVHISSGDSIQIGAPLVSVEARSDAAPKIESASPTESARKRPKVSTTEVAEDVPGDSQPVRSAATRAKGQIPPPAGPATRRLARKLGVYLSQVTGTARGGRITIEDVEAHVHDRLSGPRAASAGSASVGIVAAAPLPDFSQFGPTETERLNKIYRTAAAGLHAAWITIPHVTQHNLADITELEAARKRYVETNPDSPKITMTAIMIKAVVGALRAFPQFNSSIDVDAGELILKKYFHIGVAVDTPAGLVVPVICNCDQKNVLQVAAELTELAGRARERRLKSGEMQGASFTITNLGGIGGTYFTPIVNHPEVAILGMSRGQKAMQLKDGQVIERLMLPLSLSYDHRAINGADAARFIVKLSGSLSNFFELF